MPAVVEVRDMNANGTLDQVASLWALSATLSIAFICADKKKTSKAISDYQEALI